MKDHETNKNFAHFVKICLSLATRHQFSRWGFQMLLCAATVLSPRAY